MRTADRYLELVRGRWCYVRRVPKAVAALDSRGKLQITLGTASLDEARIRRDAMAAADTLNRASLLGGGARSGHRALLRGATARRFGGGEPEV